MPYTATVFSLLVAGPSDVNNERRHVKLAVDEWNQLHSRSYGIEMRAVGWESLRPELADGPQPIINRKLVDQCDGLVAVFSARIGSKTATEISGTAEEIKRSHKNGKAVMVYFSNAAIKRKDLNVQQLTSLAEFRNELKKLGLLGEFASAKDLHQKVLADLSKLARDFADQGAKLTPRTPPEVHTAMQDLSRKACLSLASISPIATLQDATEITFNFRNEGDYPAYDVKVSFDGGNGFPTEPQRVNIREIPPAQNAPRTRSGQPRTYGITHRVKKPGADASGEPIKDQELQIRVRATFRDGRGERDEAIFVVHCRNEGWGWKPVEDRSQAALSPICRFVRPEAQANPQPFPLTRAVAPAVARPKQLSDIEHEMMKELVRRVAVYPEVFRASIWRLPPGDDQHGYQSDHITGTPVPSDARDMVQNDRDVVPVLIQQGFLHPESRHKVSIDDSLFYAYGFEPPL